MMLPEIRSADVANPIVLIRESIGQTGRGRSDGGELDVERFDVVVVGARLAGCAVAAHERAGVPA